MIRNCSSKLTPTHYSFKSRFQLAQQKGCHCWTITFRAGFQSGRDSRQAFKWARSTPVILTQMPHAVLPSIINAVILTSAFSSGSGILFIASRVLYGLAIRGQAPRFLKRCTKSGLPYAAILVSVRAYLDLRNSFAC